MYKKLPTEPMYKDINDPDDHMFSQLCFVQDHWYYEDETGNTVEEPNLELFFTTAPMALQWGDDWDDYPYEYNAGYPYDCWFDNEGQHECVIYTLRLKLKDVHYKLPKDFMEDSQFSAAEINSGRAAWLYIEGSGKRCDGVAIQAGMTPAEVISRLAPHIVVLPAPERH